MDVLRLFAAVLKKVLFTVGSTLELSRHSVYIYDNFLQKDADLHVVLHYCVRTLTNNFNIGLISNSVTFMPLYEDNSFFMKQEALPN